MRTSPACRWALTDKERTRQLFDAATGRLLSVEDKHGNIVTYMWGPDSLVITAANGQIISVALAGGWVSSATYATPAG